MKWSDFYIILVITAILRLLISNNALFVLSGLPLGVYMGHRRAMLNIEANKEEKK